ncbi:hypothetical protein [Actinoplanes couchii]|uniref:Uncharacterized protein n=1 Tax=Actinoplanes couchii TaxID=403638 RepID=A0ABQ3XG62_9ACTN|nr:hypothetical protein [Actinoplanes couchii]MDR6320982.1 hypothetical protein [Actinoplanes couchii]GID57494.1 hypothetical protein Aco03nite_058980 [Actinoplanes couchii]
MTVSTPPAGSTTTCRTGPPRTAPAPATWGPDGTVVTCAGDEVGRFGQAPDYPLILMLDLFEIGTPSPEESAYPKTARIHRVHAHNARP